MPQIVIEILDRTDVTVNTFNLNENEKLKKTIEKFRKDVKKILSDNPRILKCREVMQ